MEKVEDNKIADTKMVKIILKFTTKRIAIVNKMKMSDRIIVKNNPDILWFNFSKIGLKILIKFPIQTTGCSFVGNSPKTISKITAKNIINNIQSSMQAY